MITKYGRRIISMASFTAPREADSNYTLGFLYIRIHLFREWHLAWKFKPQLNFDHLSTEMV